MLRLRFISFLLGFAALIGSFFFFSFPKHQYQLAICAIFKNEAPWLKEWIVYHHDILGFEHFYLYNNDSTDNYRETLAPFIDNGTVELIEWNTCEEHQEVPEEVRESPCSWHLCQLAAYNNCLKKRAFGKAKWVAVIDIDEFIVPVKGVKSFRSYLKSAEKRKKGCIKLSWRMFGTSSIWDLKPGELLTEKMILRGNDDNYSHNWAKCMYRPEAVEFCHVHDAGIIEDRYKPGKLKGKFRSRHVNPDEIRIHHYWSRTEKFCLKKRGTIHPMNERSESFNSVEDRTIHQYLTDLKKALCSYDEKMK